MSDDTGQIGDGEYDDDDASIARNNGSGIKKKLLLVVLPLLLLGGAGTGAYFSGIFDEEKQEAVEAEKPPASPPVQISFVDLPVMLVNLNSMGTKPKFMKVQVSLEIVSNNETVIELGDLSPRIVDQLQVYLRELRIDDLRDGRGLDNLRRELLLRLKPVIRPTEIRDIVFRDILIQ